MKISKKSLMILSNFSKINNSMLFRVGKEQRVNTNNKTIQAIAELDEEFPIEFAIWDMGQFLSVISLFNDPDIDFEQDMLLIKEGKKKVKYFYSDKSLILSLNGTLKLPTVDVQFELTNDILSQVKKSAKVFSSEYIGIVGDREKIYLATINPKNEQQSAAVFEVGETKSEFNIILNLDRLNWVDGNYDVKLCSKMLGKATCKDTVLSYAFTAEARSTYKE